MLGDVWLERLQVDGWEEAVARRKELVLVFGGCLYPQSQFGITQITDHSIVYV